MVFFKGKFIKMNSRAFIINTVNAQGENANRNSPWNSLVVQWLGFSLPRA